MQENKSAIGYMYCMHNEIQDDVTLFVFVQLRPMQSVFLCRNGPHITVYYPSIHYLTYFAPKGVVGVLSLLHLQSLRDC